MLQFFLELKSSYGSDFGQDLFLFNNKEILIENKTFFYKMWFQREVFRIHDLLTTNGTFLSHCEFTQKYDIKCNFLQYFQVVSAIPRRLVEKAKQSMESNPAFSLNDTSFQLSPSVKVNLLKMKSKDYYWLFIDKVDPEVKGKKKWARELHSNELQLNRYFKNLNSIAEMTLKQTCYLQLKEPHCY